MLYIWFILIGILCCIPVKAQELTLYIIPSPEEIDWTSPSSLMRTTLSNQFKDSPGPVDYPLGHIYVELKHPERGEKVLTGITRDHHNSAVRKIFRKGYGMGILFADIEGRLQGTGEVQKSLDALLGEGAMSFITFKISEDAYSRLLDYLFQYRNLELDGIYNGLNRPRECLGAGCAAFGMSFLEVAGIDFSHWAEDWSVNIDVPDRLIGGLGVNNRHVSLLRLLLSFNWAREGEDYFSFEVYEPYLMHQWVMNRQYSPNQPDEPEFKTTRKKNAVGIEIDLSHHAVPNCPLFVCPGLRSETPYSRH